MPPVSSTSACCAIKRLKFCLCRHRPASASKANCNCKSVNAGGISSNTNGRKRSLARRRDMADARRLEEKTYELHSLMRKAYAVCYSKKKKKCMTKRDSTIINHIT